jgi:hypothetical protein
MGTTRKRQIICPILAGTLLAILVILCISIIVGTDDDREQVL